MKKQILVFALSILVAAIGCKKDDKTSSTPATPTTSFTAKLNGTTVNSVSTTVTKQPDGSGGSVLSLSAAFTHESQTASLAFFLTEYTGVKSYTDAPLLFGSADTSKAKSNTEGIVVITKDDGTYVEGTIKGVVYKNGDSDLDSLVITDGVFKMKLP